jgi:hypothetical protein
MASLAERRLKERRAVDQHNHDATAHLKDEKGNPTPIGVTVGAVGEVMVVLRAIRGGVYFIGICAGILLGIAAWPAVATVLHLPH